LPLNPSTRRHFLLAAAATGAVAITGDATFVEPNLPRIVRKEFLLPRWPERLDGFTVALLSDFHYDPYFSVHPLRAAIPMVNTLKRQLSAPHGLWAVLGNHDWETDPDIVTGALQAENIRVMANQSEPMERDGARFWLSGVTDVLSRTADLSETLRRVPAGEAVILLAHEPDFADHACRFPIDLQLSGHSHGGQIRIPLCPPLYLPPLARKYVLGTYRVGDLTLYTNAGLGTVMVPMRLNCPPEITLLTLRSAKR
jgi:predicted MPP superfamily phosphohydrolase